MSDRPPVVNRTLVGWLAILCVVGGLLTLALDSFENPWAGSLIRVGVVLCVLWIALPTPTRPAAWTGMSPWLTIVGVVIGLFAVKRPLVFFPLVAAVAVAALLLRPRRTGR